MAKKRPAKKATQQCEEQRELEQAVAKILKDPFWTRHGLTPPPADPPACEDELKRLLSCRGIVVDHFPEHATLPRRPCRGKWLLDLFAGLVGAYDRVPDFDKACHAAMQEILADRFWRECLIARPAANTFRDFHHKLSEYLKEYGLEAWPPLPGSYEDDIDTARIWFKALAETVRDLRFPYRQRKEQVAPAPHAPRLKPHEKLWLHSGSGDAQWRTINEIVADEFWQANGLKPPKRDLDGFERDMRTHLAVRGVDIAGDWCSYSDKAHDWFTRLKGELYRRQSIVMHQEAQTPPNWDWEIKVPPNTDWASIDWDSWHDDDGSGSFLDRILNDPFWKQHGLTPPPADPKQLEAELGHLFWKQGIQPVPGQPLPRLVRVLAMFQNLVRLYSYTSLGLRGAPLPDLHRMEPCELLWVHSRDPVQQWRVLDEIIEDPFWPQSNLKPPRADLRNFDRDLCLYLSSHGVDQGGSWEDYAHLAVDKFARLKGAVYRRQMAELLARAAAVQPIVTHQEAQPASAHENQSTPASDWPEPDTRLAAMLALIPHAPGYIRRKLLYEKTRDARPHDKGEEKSFDGTLRTLWTSEVVIKVKGKRGHYSRVR